MAAKGRPDQPVGEEERQNIIADMKTGMSRNAIARKYERSGWTITDIANSVEHVFDRRQTELARAALALDVREAQEQMAKMFLEVGMEALEEATGGRYEITQWSAPTEHSAGRFVRTSVEPTPNDKQRLVTTAAISMQRARELLADGVSSEVASARSLLTGVRDALSRVVDEPMPAAEDPTRMPD